MNGHCALVTGASRGLGAAIAARLAGEGAFVFGTATTAAGADAIGKALGDRGRGLQLEVSDADAIQATVKAIADDRGPVTLLINNAGIVSDALVPRLSDEDWGRVIEINLTAAFRLSRACLRGMFRERRGRIVSISSVIASLGNAGQSAYGASKAGLEGLTRSLAREVASREITVNAVAPGFIETDMTAALSEEQRQQIAVNIPLGRLGVPADVAAAVAFLCSDEACWITGQTLHVNGGMLAGG